MDLMKLFVRIDADTKGAEAGLTKTQKLGKSFSTGIKKVTKAAGVAIAAATAGVVAFTKASLDAGMKFDASMSNVAAISGATGKELQDLRDKAKEMGAKTKFSATEAADAFSYMAMAGWKTEDMLNGIEGIMNLAAASGEDLATTSDIVTDALTAFGLSASDSGHFADILAAASSNANTNVGMMGETFKYVAPVAGALGLEADDVAVAIGLMANSGIKASQAGTALRSILTRMVKPTKQSQAAMDALGISITNSDGSMKSMDEIMVMLREKFDGLTEAEQAEYAALLAGQQGMSGLLAIVNASEEDFDKLTAAVENCDGAAEKMAETMQDNLQGDLTIFKSALEGAQIALSDKLTPSLREFVQYGTGAVADLTKAFEEDGLNGAMAALGHIISDGIALILKGLPQFVEAGIALLGAIIKGIMDNFPALVKAAGQVAETIISKIMTYVEEKNPQLAKVLNTIGDAVKSVYEAIKGYWTDTLYPALQLMWSYITVTLVPAIQQKWQDLQPKIEAVFTAIKGFWEDTLSPALKDMWQYITKTLVPAIQQAWEILSPRIKAVFDALKEFWTTTLEPIYQSMKKWIVDDLIPKIQTAWEGFQTKIKEVFNGIVNIWDTVLWPVFNGIKTFLEQTLKPVFENVFNAISTIVDTTLKAIDKLWDKSVKPIYEGIIKFFEGVFKGDWETTWNGLGQIVDGIWNGIQIAAETIWENAKTWAQTIIANFKIAWDNAWAIVKDSVLGIWDGITNKVKEIWEGALEWGHTIFTNFKTSVTEGWDSIKEWFEGLWDEIKAIPKKLIDDALNWGKDMIQNFKDGITQKWEDLKQSVSDVGQGIKNFLGFSVPKEGPLSDFDTYAPDMMDLFIQGIKDNLSDLEYSLREMSLRVAKIFQQMGSGAYTAFNDALNGYFGDQLSNAIENPFENAFNSIRWMNWTSIGYSIYTGVTSYLSDIRSAFRYAFDFSDMYIKTPHIHVTGWHKSGNTNVPDFGVFWYRKAYDNPIMFTQPTVLGTPSGMKGFGDGPGGEVVLSASKLRDLVGGGGDVTNNNTFNIYQRDGENMEELARRIEDIFTRQQNQRKAAFA